MIPVQYLQPSPECVEIVEVATHVISTHSGVGYTFNTSCLLKKWLWHKHCFKHPIFIDETGPMVSEDFSIKR